MNHREIVKRILQTSTYLTLATTDGIMPWANAVFFANDEKFNLYFTSYNDSLHVQNILKKPSVAAAIFDSHIVPGTGAQGVQIEGFCQRLGVTELPQAIEVVYSKRFPDLKEGIGRDLSVEHFTLPDTIGRTDHIYRITPRTFFILDKKIGNDTRIPVNM
jgi:uncharacterized protein YhbP (UPF0306 family)